MNKKSFFLFAILLAAAQSQLCALFNPFDAMASLTNAMTSASLVGGQAMGKLAMAGGQMAGQAMLTQQAVMNNLQQGMMAGQQGLQQGLAQGAAIGTQPVMQSNAPVGQGNAADQMGGGAGNGQQEAALQAQQAEQAQARHKQMVKRLLMQQAIWTKRRARCRLSKMPRLPKQKESLRWPWDRSLASLRMQLTHKLMLKRHQNQLPARNRLRQ